MIMGADLAAALMVGRVSGAIATTVGWSSSWQWLRGERWHLNSIKVLFPAGTSGRIRHMKQSLGTAFFVLIFVVAIAVPTFAQTNNPPDSSGATASSASTPAAAAEPQTIIGRITKLN